MSKVRLSRRLKKQTDRRLYKLRLSAWQFRKSITRLSTAASESSLKISAALSTFGNDFSEAAGRISHILTLDELPSYSHPHQEPEND